MCLNSKITYFGFLYNNTIIFTTIFQYSSTSGMLHQFVHTAGTVV